MPSIVVFLCLALPWLNPFSPGPTPAVLPWLMTLASLALLLPWLARVRLAQVAPAAWLAAALVSAALGLLQYFGAAAVLGPWVNNTVTGEAFANLRQRNQFATLTNIGLAALLWWWVRRPAPRVLGVMAAALLAVGNAASSSRTGLVQLVILLAMAWGWDRRDGQRRQPDRWWLLVVAALAYAGAALALPLWAGLDLQASGILARLHDGGPQCASRLTLWSNVVHLIAQKPWWGWGWGELTYAHFITLYPGARFCEILDNAHNLPLHLAVELGVPAAALVCGAGVWWVWRARPWQEADPIRRMAWAVLAAILLHSLLEYPLWYGPFQVAFGLCLWLLWRPAARASAPVLSAWAAIFLLAFSGYAAWDYERVSQIYRVPETRSPAYRENTLEKVGDSVLFRQQVRFAELTTTELTLDNAAQIKGLALGLLHFSPEPRVVEKLIESASLLGLKDEALFYLVRYQAAYPDSHARWAAQQP